MVPADELTPKGTDIGINIYIDRALAGAWGKGDRLYMQGPWKPGVPSQGYQLPLTPAQLYRAGIEATNALLPQDLRQDLRPARPRRSARSSCVGLSGGKITLRRRPAGARLLGPSLYQNVMEGMFADPIYGGNRDKAGWKLIGFPGVDRRHRENVEKYQRQAVPRRSRRHRGHELREAHHGNQT